MTDTNKALKALDALDKAINAYIEESEYFISDTDFDVSARLSASHAKLKVVGTKNVRAALSPNAVVIEREELNLIMKSLTAFVYETTHLSRCEENGSHKCVISAETLELGRKCRAILSQYGEQG